MTLTKRLSILLLVPAFGALLALFDIYHYLSTTAADSHSIEALTSLRFINERLYTDSDRYIHHAQAEGVRDLHRDIGRFETVLDRLGRSAEVRSYPAQCAAAMQQVRRAWAPVRSAAAALASAEPRTNSSERLFQRLQNGMVPLDAAVSQALQQFNTHSSAARREMLVTAVTATGLGVLALCLGGLVLVRSNATARSALEVAEEVERNLGALAENAYDGILVKCGGRHVFANSRIEEMLGYAPGELLNSGIDDIVTPERASEAQLNFIGRSTGSLGPGQYETLYLRKDGSPVPVEVTAAGGAWHGEPAVILIVRDIAERKRSEAALREAEARFRQLTDNIREVFFIRDLDQNNKIYISPAYEEIWGRPVSALYEDPMDFVNGVHSEDRERVLASVARQDETRREFFDEEYRIVRPDGDIRWVRARTFPVHDDDGRIIRVAGIAEDITERRTVEDALRRSEAQLRQIIDLVPHAIYAKDAQGRFLLVNRASGMKYGMTCEELAGRLQREIHPDAAEAERMLADDLEVIRSQQRMDIPEETFLTAAGRRVVLQTTKIPFVASSDGRPAVLGVSTDITARVEMEEALRRSDERLRRSQRFGEIGTWDWNIETGELYWSEFVGPLFGYSEGESDTSYAAFMAAVHPDDRGLIAAAMKQCMDEGIDYAVEHRVVWPDGSVHWLRETGDVVRNTSGKAIRMLGAVHDITPRKEAELALRASERKYRAVMEGARDAIVMTTLDGKFVDVNHRAEKLLGYTREELLSLHVSAIHPPSEHAKLQAVFAEIRNKGASVHEHLVLRKDGSVFTAEVAGAAVDVGETRLAVGIFRDLTERQRAEAERLEQAAVQRDTLVREVHHRIKNNLQGVAGLLRQHATQYPDLRAPLETAIGQVHSMAIVHGLQGRSGEQVVLCEMVTAICRSAGGLTGKAIEPHVAVEVAKPVRVATDEAVPVALILNELIFNAVKHAGTGSRPVHVYVRDADNGVCVRILAPAVHLPQGFDFDAGRGLGTGLKLVRSLLPPTGCRLRFDNDAGDVVAELRLGPPVVVLEDQA